MCKYIFTMSPVKCIHVLPIIAIISLAIWQLTLGVKSIQPVVHSSCEYIGGEHDNNALQWYNMHCYPANCTSRYSIIKYLCTNQRHVTGDIITAQAGIVINAFACGYDNNDIYFTETETYNTNCYGSFYSLICGIVILCIGIVLTTFTTVVLCYRGNKIQPPDVEATVPQDSAAKP